jgi:glycerol uptake facilitator-like aquaporin
MGRQLTAYLATVVGAGVVAAITVLSVRAQDPALAGVGLAAAVAVMAILTVDTRFGVGILDPAWSLSLMIRGRIRVADLLPLWAAQAVGAVAFGALARWLVDDLRQWSIIEQPDIAPAAVVVALLAFVGTWVAVAVDTRRVPAAAAGLPALGVSAALPPTFAAAANPAGLFALGVAGVAEWEYVFFVTVAAFAGAVLGALTTPIVQPTTVEH